MQKFTISSLLLAGLLTGSGVQPSNAQGLSVGTSSTSQQVLVAIPNQSIINTSKKVPILEPFLMC